MYVLYAATSLCEDMLKKIDILQWKRKGLGKAVYVYCSEDRYVIMILLHRCAVPPPKLEHDWGKCPTDGNHCYTFMYAT